MSGCRRYAITVVNHDVSSVEVYACTKHRRLLSADGKCAVSKETPNDVQSAPRKKRAKQRE